MSIIDSFPKKGKQQNNLIQYTPIGTIIAVMGTSAPNNYLICDGSVYNIVDYPELANYFQTQFGSKNYFGGDNNITFAVPDLRGEFLRGAGTNSHANQGNGSSVGTHQDNGLPNITADPFFCDWYTSTGLNSLSVNGAFVRGSNTPGRITAEQSAPGAAATFGFDASKSNSIYGNSDYVTPTNTSVLYCIAYKDYVTLGISSNNEEETTSGHIISSNGTELEEQPVLNFTDFDISNDTDNNETDIKQHRLTQEELNEIASELPDVIDNKNKIKYSLEEQVVGEWIDGKPIYQKSFNFDNTLKGADLPTDLNKTIVNIIDYDFIHYANGTSTGDVVNKGGCHPNGTATWASWLYLVKRDSNDYWQVASRIGTSLGTSTCSFIITVRYTKTTD